MTDYQWVKVPGGKEVLVGINASKETNSAHIPKNISDSLGVTENELEKFEADRKLHGFTGVRFVPDPISKGFYQLEYDNPEVFERYGLHRGFYNKTNGSVGLKLSEQDLSSAKASALSQYPVLDL